MGLFKRGDVVDLTEWKRRGLLEMPAEEKPLAPLDKYGMLDFTALPRQEAQTSVADVQPLAPSVAPTLDFLENPSLLSTGSSNAPPLGPHIPRPEMNELKLKLDDTMFKLDLLLDKIRNIEVRLGLS